MLPFVSVAECLSVSVPSSAGFWAYLNPKEPTFLGLLIIMISLYTSLILKRKVLGSLGIACRAWHCRDVDAFLYALYALSTGLMRLQGFLGRTFYEVHSGLQGFFRDFRKLCSPKP